ncbi:PREDICTED: very-long-chain (3R)-3-hydroxyacyl-CoA dehydratase 3 [Aptenodytes forsteri]|uniref:very-long-chain (3R)-3-hydroxyacyl-CoA dehydratase 3 n=1 Tax=Aptenodytes forsteri TaxID=9233 RepID=UPI0004F40193|nr:PREDICTED: very-long-chain (3R)-3-hydroxyacyl-CoA dehydratase 3 [Aptenodytes forsteri]
MNFARAMWKAIGEVPLRELLRERGVAFLKVSPKSMLPFFSLISSKDLGHIIITMRPPLSEDLWRRGRRTGANTKANSLRAKSGGEAHLRDWTSHANPDITIADNVLRFKAQGHGAKGDNIYEFQIEFLEPVEPKPVCRVTQRQLNITVQKKESNWWERLTKQEKRPLFLAPDFDRWLDESDAEMELKEKEEEKINKMKIESRVPKDPFKHLKKGYLIMYNLVQFLGFSWIFVNMTVRLFILGTDSFYDTFHTIADMMYFCQTLALMEIMNSLIGLVRSPLRPTVAQIFGRNFVLFVVLGSLEEMQSKPVVFFIFYFWSIIELFRYPYYMLSCIGIEWKPLTWLRYTAWIPLYPLGGLAEAVCIIQSIPIFSETGKFSLGLPNPLNVTIQFSFLLQIYLIALFLGVYINFHHLYKQRKQHLGPKKRKMK